jgi:hypothetical protein
VPELLDTFIHWKKLRISCLPCPQGTARFYLKTVTKVTDEFLLLCLFIK